MLTRVTDRFLAIPLAVGYGCLDFLEGFFFFRRGAPPEFCRVASVRIDTLCAEGGRIKGRACLGGARMTMWAPDSDHAP